MDLMQYHYLLKYIYPECSEISYPAQDGALEEVWNQWHCAIMIESNLNFFDEKEDPTPEFQKELRVDFFHMQLNLHQQLLLFRSAYCDYGFVASRLYAILKRRYTTQIHIAVSHTFEGIDKLPEAVVEMEKLLEGKFYHPEDRVLYVSEHYDPVNVEAMDSRLVDEINQDVVRKDVDALRLHFGTLKKKYEKQTRSSLMYVKFIFSNVLQDLYQGDFSTVESLRCEIDALYSCTELSRIIQIVEKNVNVFCAFVETDMIRTREKILWVIEYMKDHVAEDLNAEILGEKVGLHPGYLVSSLRRETGMNLNHLRFKTKMVRAKELLTESHMTLEAIGRAVGISSYATFARLYQQYYGVSDLFETESC